MKYELILPDGYIPPILPQRDEITAALRSGNYKQTRGVLANGEGYCCLGVISAIQGRLTDKGCAFYDGEGDEECGLDGDNPLYPILGESGEFPKGVQVNQGKYTKYSLIGLNDSFHLSFEEIADVIEKVWRAPETNKI